MSPLLITMARPRFEEQALGLPCIEVMLQARCDSSELAPPTHGELLALDQQAMDVWRALVVSSEAPLAMLFVTTEVVSLNGNGTGKVFGLDGQIPFSAPVDPSGAKVVYGQLRSLPQRAADLLSLSIDRLGFSGLSRARKDAAIELGIAAEIALLRT